MSYIIYIYTYGPIDLQISRKHFFFYFCLPNFG